MSYMNVRFVIDSEQLTPVITHLESRDIFTVFEYLAPGYPRVEVTCYIADLLDAVTACIIGAMYGGIPFPEARPDATTHNATYTIE